MIEFRPSRPEEEGTLRRLWERAFHEEGAFVDAFFSLAYSPERSRVAEQDGEILAMAYWFDCKWQGKKLAYLYGVATDPEHQGKGIASALLRDLHSHLEEQGYAGALLVPGGADLFRFYEKLGYRTAGAVSEPTVQAGTPVSIREIGVTEYAGLRRKFLPEGGVIQEGENLALLHALARLYTGEGFLAAVSREENGPCLELLGGETAAPGLLGALGIRQAKVRVVGGGRPFAMARLWDMELPPEGLYFGLAFD